MAASTTGRLASFKLADVPLALRRRAGSRLIAEAAENRNLLLATELKRAIERPSDTTYWMPAEQLERVLR